MHNRTGRRYFWWRGDERADAPRPSDLPYLPVAWARYLRSSARYAPGRVADEQTAAAWYEAVADEQTCSLMRRAAESGANDLRAAANYGGLHDAMIRVTTYLCRCAAEGHTGLGEALGVVHAAFTASRRQRGLSAEWLGAMAGAKAHAAALDQADHDPCDETRGLRAPRRRTHR